MDPLWEFMSMYDTAERKFTKITCLGCWKTHPCCLNHINLFISISFWTCSLEHRLSLDMFCWWIDYPWMCSMKDRYPWMCSMKDRLSLDVFTRVVIQTHGLSLFRDLLLHQFTWIKIVYILWIKILLLLIPLKYFKVIILCVVVHWTEIGTPDSYRKTPFSCILL